MIDDYNTNSRYTTYTFILILMHFLFRRLGECTFWAWEWKDYAPVNNPAAGSALGSLFSDRFPMCSDSIVFSVRRFAETSKVSTPGPKTVSQLSWRGQKSRENAPTPPSFKDSSEPLWSRYHCWLSVTEVRCFIYLWSFAICGTNPAMMLPCVILWNLDL